MLFMEIYSVKIERPATWMPVGYPNQPSVKSTWATTQRKYEKPQFNSIQFNSIQFNYN